MQQRLRPVDNLHGTATQHKGGSDHDGVAQLFGLLQSTLLVGCHAARRLLDVQLGQDLIPFVSVLSIVNVLWLCAPDADIAITYMS